MFKRLLQIKLKYLLHNSYVRAIPGSKIRISQNSHIKNCRIIVGSEGSVSIGANVKIENAIIFINRGNIIIENNSTVGNKQSRTTIYIEAGNCTLCNHSILGDNRNDCEIIIEKGDFRLEPFSKFGGARIWIRFGGNLSIGEYTNINHGTEIRCDEKIIIGRYCQISYNIRIWDTNTHEMLTKEMRRERTAEFFPIYGKELNKPKTKSVIIGNDCWIGENCAILKGSEIGDECILGFHTIITGRKIPSGKTVLNNSEIRII